MEYVTEGYVLSDNVCFAFERNAELASYEPVVRKTGRVLQHMEVCLVELAR